MEKHKALLAQQAYFLIRSSRSCFVAHNSKYNFANCTVTVSPQAVSLPLPKSSTSAYRRTHIAITSDSINACIPEAKSGTMPPVQPCIVSELLLHRKTTGTEASTGAQNASPSCAFTTLDRCPFDTRCFLWRRIEHYTENNPDFFTNHIGNVTEILSNITNAMGPVSGIFTTTIHLMCKRAHNSSRGSCDTPPS